MRSSPYTPDRYFTPERILILVFALMMLVQGYPLFMSYGIGATMQVLHFILFLQGAILILLVWAIIRAKQMRYLDLSSVANRRYLYGFFALLLFLVAVGVIAGNQRPNIMRDVWILSFYLIFLRVAFFPRFWNFSFRAGVIAFWIYLPLVVLGLTRTGISAFVEGIGPGLAIPGDARFVNTAGYGMRGFLYIWPILFAYAVLSKDQPRVYRILGGLTPILMLILLVFLFAFRTHIALIGVQIFSVFAIGCFLGSFKALGQLSILGIFVAIAVGVWAGTEQFEVLAGRISDQSSWDYRLVEVEAMARSTSSPDKILFGHGAGGSFPFYIGGGTVSWDMFIRRTEIHLGVFWPYLKGGLLLCAFFFIPMLKGLAVSFRRIRYEPAVASAYAVLPVYLLTWLINPFPSFSIFYPFVPIAMCMAVLMSPRRPILRGLPQARRIRS